MHKLSSSCFFFILLSLLCGMRLHYMLWCPIQPCRLQPILLLLLFFRSPHNDKCCLNDDIHLLLKTVMSFSHSNDAAHLFGWRYPNGQKGWEEATVPTQELMWCRHPTRARCATVNIDGNIPEFRLVLNLNYVECACDEISHWYHTSEYTIQIWCELYY